MTLQFQYNKTSLQEIQRQMNIRLRALPVLKNKESALRVEVKKTRKEIVKMEFKLKERKNLMHDFAMLWNEFDMSIISLKEVELKTIMIAGVKVPELFETHYTVKKFSYFNNPHWFPEGVEVLKDMSDMAIRMEILKKRFEILDKARKKTTQKVNLYEKNQIPAFDDAARKIKRFLEDEENLSKSSQKILKNRLGSI